MNDACEAEDRRHIFQPSTGLPPAYVTFFYNNTSLASKDTISWGFLRPLADELVCIDLGAKTQGRKAGDALCFRLGRTGISPMGMDSFEGSLLMRSICLNIIRKEKKGYRRARVGFSSGGIRCSIPGL